MNEPKFLTFIRNILNTDPSIAIIFVEFFMEDPEVRVFFQHLFNMPINKEEQTIDSRIVLNFPLFLNKSDAFSVGL